MSSLLEPMEVETTESLGFKFLFSKPLLPSVDETIPFSKLSNVSIHPVEKLLCVASAKTTSVYDLQSIRDGSYDAVNTKEFPSNVVGVFFVASTLCAVLEDGVIWVTEVPDYSWKEHSSTDSNAVSCTVFNGKLFVLGENNILNKVDLSTKGTTKQLTSIEKCVDLASTEDKLYILHKNGNVTVLNKSLVESSTIEKPSLDDPSEPISINVLSSNHLLVSYGEPVDTVEEEDIMYDLTAYIVDLNTKQFTPSMDIAPPYSTVKRNPSYYTQTLFEITKQLPYLFVVGSACASEISIATSSQVFKPDQDAACAILPINPNSDNDTQPVGIALDLFSKGTVFEPCSGVDSADNLPLLYVLTNLGELYCWALYHHTALQDTSFSLDQSRSHYLKLFKDLSVTDGSLLSAKVESQSSAGAIIEEPSKSETKEAPTSQGGSSILGTTDAFSKGFSFGTPTLTPSPVGSSNSGSSNNNTIANSSSAFGKPAFGKPAFGSSAFGQNDTAPKFGESISAPTSSGAFGKPTFGNSTFGANTTPSATESAFGKPEFGASTTTGTNDSPFGKPAFGANTTESSFGKPTFGASAATGTTESPFGKPAFGGSTADSPFGKPAFGANATTGTTDSPFGKPAFGASATTSTNESPFGKPAFSASSTTSTNESPFGKPAFGASATTGTTESPFGKPAFGASATTSTNESPFGKSAFGASTTESPFGKPAFGASATTSTKESPFGKPALGGSVFGAAAAGASLSSPFSTDNDSKSSQKTPIPDPFGHLKTSKESSNTFSFTDVADAITDTSETAKKDTEFSGVSKAEYTSDSSIEEDNSLESESSEEESSSTAEITSINSNFRNLGSNTEGGSNDLDESEANIATEPEPEDKVEVEAEEEVEMKAEEDVEAKEEAETKEEAAEEAKEEEETEEETEEEAEEEEEPEKEIEKETKEETEEKAEEEDQIESEEETKTSSVASLTDRIKKAANVSTAEIPVTFSQNTKTESKDQSPFSAFSNFQNKETAVTPTFSFGKHNDSQKSKDSPFSFSQKSAESNNPKDELMKFSTKPSALDSETHATDSSPPSKVDVALTPSKVAYESKEMQTDVVLKNNSTQTDSKDKKDKSQQAFENDEQHLASIYESQHLPDFFNAAQLRDFKPLSSDQVIQAIERTHAEVLGNIQVLKANINNIGEFVNDQTQHPFQRTEATINNVSSWRIDEAQDLLEILTSKKNDISKLKESSKYLEDNCSEDLDLDVLLNNLKRQFDALSICNEHYNNPKRKLSWSQHHISAVVKKMLETTSLRLDKIKETIRVLKLYNLSDNKETINIIKQLTANGGSGRTNLLREIKALREEVSNLKISMEKNQSVDSKKVLLSNSASPVPLVETTLELNIRSQLGDFFSSRVGC